MPMAKRGNSKVNSLRSDSTIETNTVAEVSLGRDPTPKTAALALIERTEQTNMKPKNTICLWFDKDAHEAARFYAATFPDSTITAVHKAPGDYPGGKKGDELTVEFTVLGIPCLGLNGGPAFRHTEAFSNQNCKTRPIQPHH